MEQGVCGDPGAVERAADAEEEAVNDLPSMNINTEELIAAVESLIGLAKDQRPDAGSVNWNNLRVCDIEYRASLLRPEDGPFCVALVREAACDGLLASWLYERLDKVKFPRVYIECEW